MRISDWSSDVCSSDLIAEQPTRVAIEDRGFGEIGVHRGRTDADQHRIIMRIEAFGGADVDAGVRAQPLADEVRMHRRRGEHAGDRDAIRPDIFVGAENLALALAHRLFGLVADALYPGAPRLDWARAV